MTPSASRGDSHPGFCDATGTKGRVGMTFGQDSGPKMHPKVPGDPFSEAFSAKVGDFGATKLSNSPPGALSIAKIRDFWGADSKISAFRGDP